MSWTRWPLVLPLLLALAATVGHAELVAPQIASHSLVALDTSAAGKCAAGPLKVLVRISSCFALADVRTIDSWVSASLVSALTPFYVDGVAVQVSYYARLETPASGCGSGVAPTDATTFKSGLASMVYDNPAAPISSPDTVIKFVKDSGDLSTAAVAGASAQSMQFRVCAWSCAVLATDKVLATLDDLADVVPASVARYFPCSRVADAVAIAFTDSSSKPQCSCVCPSGTSLVGDACKASASTAGSCPWNSDNTSAGYTCKWSSASASPLKLVSDCKVDVLVPSDNYVADRRVNVNDMKTAVADPMIQVVSSIQSTTLAKTWQQYSAQPQAVLDKVELSSFGLYNLSMTATDYHGEVSCGGCVAVVDSYPPHAVQACGTASWGSTLASPTDLTSATLQTAITKEASFNAFSSAQNVVNNGASERVDLLTRTMRDWLGSAFLPLSSDTTACFHDLAVRDLLLLSSMADSPLALSSTALSGLQCVRCCAKVTTLREYYYDYKCSSASATKLVSGSESCSFAHCMRIPASTLVQATAASPGATSLTSPLAITRNSTCAALSSSCPYTATLASLVNATAAWSSDLPNQGNYLRGFNVSAFVFWRYKRGSDDWAAWDGAAVLSFTSASTTLGVQAWTRCGMAKQFDFVVSVTTTTTALVPSTAQTRSGTATTMSFAVTSLTAVPAACNTGEAMLGFRLYTGGGSAAYYSVQCLSSASMTNGLSKTTGWTSVASAPNLVSPLSNLAIDCGFGAITSFQLEQQNANTVRYKYTCTASLTPLACTSGIVTAADVQGDGAIYLDRHQVSCPAGSFLAKTQLQYSASATSTFNALIWYTSTCCSYQYAARRRIAYGAAIPATLAGLVAVEPSCLSGEAVSGFSFDYYAASYTVSCVADPRLSPGQQLYTGWTTYSDTIVALSSHTLDCGTSAINRFRLDMEGGMIRYAYSCTKTTTAMTTCTSVTGASTGVTGSATSALNGIAAACSSEYFMTRMTLVAASSGSAPYYQLTCCLRP